MNVELVSKTEPNKSYFHDKIQELIDNDVIDLVEANEAKKNLNAEQLIIYIARVTSSRENKLEDYVVLLNYLMKNSHWSPFEHAYFTFEIETSRAIGRQLIRHRSFTFQEFSQRYAKVTKFEDIELRKQAENNRQSSEESISTILGQKNTPFWVGHNYDNIGYGQCGAVEDAAVALRDIKEAYDKLISVGIASETARMILPECTSTTIHMTGNLRSWIHFLQIREDEHAQKEIREIAKEIKSQLTPYAENTIKAYNKYLKQ